MKETYHDRKMRRVPSLEFSARTPLVRKLHRVRNRCPHAELSLGPKAHRDLKLCLRARPSPDHKLSLALSLRSVPRLSLVRKSRAPSVRPADNRHPPSALLEGWACSAGS